MEDSSTEELHLIADGLNDLLSGNRRLMENSPKIQVVKNSLTAK